MSIMIMSKWKIHYLGLKIPKFTIILKYLNNIRENITISLRLYKDQKKNWSQQMSRKKEKVRRKNRENKEKKNKVLNLSQKEKKKNQPKSQARISRVINKIKKM